MFISYTQKNRMLVFPQLSSTIYGTKYRALSLPKLCVMVLDHYNMIQDHNLGAKSYRCTVSQPQARTISRELRLGAETMNESVTGS